MTPEQQKEAIQELQEWIYTTEADVESWGPRKEHHPLWHNYRDTKNFLARLKEPEDRCPTCLSTTKGQEGFFDEEKCSDPWHDQRDDYKPSTEDDMITGWDW
jgi:hypothetical protein